MRRLLSLWLGLSRSCCSGCCGTCSHSSPRRWYTCRGAFVAVSARRRMQANTMPACPALIASRLVRVRVGGRYGLPSCHLGRVSAVVLLFCSPASQRPKRLIGFTWAGLLSNREVVFLVGTQFVHGVG